MAARASTAWTLPGSVLAQADSQTQANAGQQNNRGGFFQTCLAKSKGSTPPEVCRWRRGIYDEIRTRMPLQGGLSIERMCQLAEVSRVGFYRYLRAGWPAEEKVDLQFRSWTSIGHCVSNCSGSSNLFRIPLPRHPRPPIRLRAS